MDLWHAYSQPLIGCAASFPEGSIWHAYSQPKMGEQRSARTRDKTSMRMPWAPPMCVLCVCSAVCGGAGRVHL
eukprot:5687668-Prymnesium_polylepis.1